MLLPNVLSFPILFYGALMAGATVVPMNPLLKAREIHYYLRDSGARIVVAAQASAQAAAEAAGGIEAVVVNATQPDELMAAHAMADPAARADDDEAAILYTSGTSGAPKEPNSPTGTCRATLARQRRRCWRRRRTTSSWVVCPYSTPSGSPAGSTRRCCQEPA
jgi:acyl-CoA synthetase (AMP-forming)/AMP-acid ligase II